MVLGSLYPSSAAPQQSHHVHKENYYENDYYKNEAIHKDEYYSKDNYYSNSSSVQAMRPNSGIHSPHHRPSYQVSGYGGHHNHHHHHVPTGGISNGYGGHYNHRHHVPTAASYGGHPNHHHVPGAGSINGACGGPGIRHPSFPGKHGHGTTHHHGGSTEHSYVQQKIHSNWISKDLDD